MKLFVTRGDNINPSGTCWQDKVLDVPIPDIWVQTLLTLRVKRWILSLCIYLIFALCRRLVCLMDMLLLRHKIRLFLSFKIKHFHWNLSTVVGVCQSNSAFFYLSVLLSELWDKLVWITPLLALIASTQSLIIPALLLLGHVFGLLLIAGSFSLDCLYCRTDFPRHWVPVRRGGVDWGPSNRMKMRQ